MTQLARYPPPQWGFGQNPSRFHDNSAKETKMDPDSLPRPSAPSNLGCYEAVERFDSDKFDFPPSSTSEFVCVDSGSATLRFARPTTNHIPSWPSLQLSAALPLGCHFQPFAKVNEREDPVPVSEPSCSSSAFRCEQCMAFVNPHFSWFDEGSSARCNMCQHVTSLPAEYKSPINGYGVRADKFMRPELRCGTVDFLPSHEVVNGGSVPVTVFVMDTSHMSVSSGFLPSVISTIKGNLTNLPPECDVGFILFDEVLNFIRFELSRNGSPSFVTVSDIDDPFIPEHSGFLLVSPHLLLDQLEIVLDSILEYAKRNNPNRVGNCSNAAVAAAIDLAADRGGGSVMVFQSSPCRPGVGPKPTAAAEVPPIPVLGEKDEKFIGELLKKCNEFNICVDLFVCADLGVSMGIQPVAALAGRLGGQQVLCSGSDLPLKLSTHLRAEKYYNCLIRVRASRGLFVDSVDVVRAVKRGTDTVSVPRVDGNFTISTQFTVTENIEQNQPAFLQLACLYSRADGVRLVRVITVMLNTTGQIGQVYKYADVEAVGLLLAKRAISNHIDRPKSSIREKLTSDTVTILHAYRTHCAATSATGQLILPDSLKTLPLMISGVLKQVGIRSEKSGNWIDERIVSFWQVVAWNIHQAAYDMIPRCYCVHPVIEGEWPLVPATRVRIHSAKIYLFDVYDELVFLIGREVEPRVVQELLGRDVAVQHMDPKKCQVLNLDCIPDNRLNWLVHALRRDRNVRLKCALSASPAGEAKISNLLTEDRLGGEPGYIDWLCLIHRLIQEKIDY